MYSFLAFIHFIIYYYIREDIIINIHLVYDRQPAPQIYRALGLDYSTVCDHTFFILSVDHTSKWSSFPSLLWITSGAGEVPAVQTHLQLYEEGKDNLFVYNTYCLCVPSRVKNILGALTVTYSCNCTTLVNVLPCTISFLTSLWVTSWHPSFWVSTVVHH